MTSIDHSLVYDPQYFCTMLVIVFVHRGGARGGLYLPSQHITPCRKVKSYFSEIFGIFGTLVTDCNPSSEEPTTNQPNISDDTPICTIFFRKKKFHKDIMAHC